MGPFLWAWHPISTAALVQCPPIAGNVKKLLSVILRLSLPLLCMGGHFVSAVTLHIEYYRRTARTL